MMMKKGQFGPDALIGMVVVALIGLGGIWFLNTYVNGLSIEGMISILDQEIDQTCFYTILPIMGDEYVREGNYISGDENYTKMQDYFGGTRHYATISSEFEYTINYYTDRIQNTPLGQKPTYIKGFLASTAGSEGLRTEIMDTIEANNWTLSKFCFVPVYNPAGGTLGTAELIIAEDSDACGVESAPCCPGDQCNPGLICNTIAGRELCRQP